MKMTLLLLLLGCGGLNAAAMVRSRSTAETFLLDGGKAGKLAIGMTADKTESAYGKTAARRTDLKLEGVPSPAIEIRLGSNSKPSLVAELEHGKVYRIGVRDSRFKTKEGIGIGATLNDIRKVYTVSGIDVGEGPDDLFVIANAIGMSFRLDRQPPDGWYKTRAQNLIPGECKVVEIVVLQPAIR